MVSSSVVFADLDELILCRELRLDNLLSSGDNMVELDLLGEDDNNEFGSIPESARLGVTLRVALPSIATEEALFVLLGRDRDFGVPATDDIGAIEDLRERVEASVGIGGGACGFRRVVRVICLVAVAVVLVVAAGVRAGTRGACEQNVNYDTATLSTKRLKKQRSSSSGARELLMSIFSYNNDARDKKSIKSRPLAQ